MQWAAVHSWIIKNRKVNLKVSTSRTPNGTSNFFKAKLFKPKSLNIKTSIVFSLESVLVRLNVNEHITTQPFICSVHVHLLN